MEMCLGGVFNGPNFTADLLPNSLHIVPHKENPFNLFAVHVIYLLFKINVYLYLTVA